MCGPSALACTLAGMVTNQNTARPIAASTTTGSRACAPFLASFSLQCDAGRHATVEQFKAGWSMIGERPAPPRAPPRPACARTRSTRARHLRVAEVGNIRLRLRGRERSERVRGIIHGLRIIENPPPLTPTLSPQADRKRGEGAHRARCGFLHSLTMSNSPPGSLAAPGDALSRLSSTALRSGPLAHRFAYVSRHPCTAVLVPAAQCARVIR